MFIFLANFCRAAEFVYPISSQESDNFLYVMYQKNPYHIELWQWERVTGACKQVLLSRFTPAGVRFLPDNSGFSFIDKGVINIKKFSKRSVRSLDLDAPLSHIELLNWINPTHCYTHASYKNHFSIVEIDDLGIVYPIVFSDEVDSMYPQRVNDDLFYIERNRFDQYCIVKTSYPVPPQDDDFLDRLATYKRQPFFKNIIVDFGFCPVVFLSMISDKEGFVIEHPPRVNKRDNSITMSYHRIYETGGQWQKDKLFNFTIPTSFLFQGKRKRLYEALLPLLPRHYGSIIFYCDSQEGNNINIFAFSCRNAVSRQITFTMHNHHFAPLLIDGNTLFYGGLLESQLNTQDGLSLNMSSLSYGA